MKTNELKKGDKIRLANGFDAEIMDNKKGNVRLAKVYGIYVELGSIYAHNIVFYYDKNNNCLPMELTKSQQKLKVLAWN